MTPADTEMADAARSDLARVVARAQEWAAHDPSESDRARVQELIAAAGQGDESAIGALSEAFAGPLTFGTAGLRGRIGPGESGMNRAVVIRTTAGLAAYLRTVVGDHPRVVIGFDARHGSATFARDAAEVAAAAGCDAQLLPGPLPTPVLAFAVRHLDADAGVMVTASHNPAADNGYKVYLGGRAASGSGRGVQIVPPADAQIAAEIAAAPPADEVPRRARGVHSLGDEVTAAYLERAATVTRPHRDRISVVLTPMHGVGGFVAQQALQASGCAQVHLVSEQAAPDPDFPTVAFPNPEEPGALDLALARARAVDADLVIALDPDADRCSVAIPAPHVEGGWRQLPGDELGAILGEAAAGRVAAEARSTAQAGTQSPSDDVLTEAVPTGVVQTGDARTEGVPAAGGPTGNASTADVPTGDAWSEGVPTAGGPTGNAPTADVPAGDARTRDVSPYGALAADGPALACSVVSGRLLGRIAAHHGLRHATTLTGFKWIARVDGLVFGYEEAIGYCTDPQGVRDKDGITAALRTVDLAAGLAQEGRTLQDALDDLARRHGLYATRPLTFRVERLDDIAAGMARVRAQPPTELAGSPVVRAVDLAQGWPEIDLPPTDGMLFLTAADDRVVVRPSGTEPKLKCYLEVVLPVEADGAIPHEAAATRLDRLAADVSAVLGL